MIKQIAISNNKMKSIVLAVVALAMVGCTERIAERKGTQIDVVPVTYSLSLKINPKQEKSAKQELTQFLIEHEKLVLTQDVELVWRTKLGKKWAEKTQSELLKRGVNSDHLTVSQSSAGFGERFDYEISIVVNRTLVNMCQYAKVGEYGHTADGCFTENARWQSMVNPENMLNESLRAEHVNK